MKSWIRLAVVAAMFLFLARPSFAQFGSILGTIEHEVEKKVDQKAEDKTDEAMDTILGNHGKSQPQTTSSSNASTSSTSGAAADVASSPAKTYAAYQNYDFKPGENIIFEDNFVDDEDGEFPSHWDLGHGQAVVNTLDGKKAFLLTEGNYAVVTPRLSTENYLSEPFTVEFDYYAGPGADDPILRFRDSKNEGHQVNFGRSVGTSYFANDLSGSDVSDEAAYRGKWHHAAVIFQKGQMKAYIDNTRALVIPRTGITATHVELCGIGDKDHPLVVTNFRIASGGSANTIGNLLTAGKFVTHGITFDVGKATLKPESMGVLNDVAKFLQSNPTSKFEIDGHTDSDGAPEANTKLSQDRADAVKAQLVAMGIDATRLSTKGLGASKPLGANDTPEHKAMNRRVEFVKQ